MYRYFTAVFWLDAVPGSIYTGITQPSDCCNHIKLDRTIFGSH